MFSPLSPLPHAALTRCLQFTRTKSGLEQRRRVESFPVGSGGKTPAAASGYSEPETTHSWKQAKEVKLCTEKSDKSDVFEHFPN